MTPLSHQHISPHPLAYRIRDATKVSGLSRSKLYELEAEGKLRMIRIGGRTLILHAELMRLLGANGQAPTAAP